jgi:hypothetical protein
MVKERQVDALVRDNSFANWVLFVRFCCVFCFVLCFLVCLVVDRANLLHYRMLRYAEFFRVWVHTEYVRGFTSLGLFVLVVLVATSRCRCEVMFLENFGYVFNFLFFFVVHSVA